MSQDHDFDDLMARLQAGDQAASGEIFHRFAVRLIALARSRLDGMIRQKEDPEDVVQSVFKSFFQRHGVEQFDLKNWDSMWSLLTIITLRKCGCRIRHFHADRRSIRREVSPNRPDDDSGDEWQAIAREPTPSEAMMFQETIERVLRSLGQNERRIVELSLQGYTPAEISLETRRSERTIYRLLDRLKRRIRDWAE